MVLPFLVEVELLLARLCWLEMYSRKFGLRLRGECGNLLKTHGFTRMSRIGSGCRGNQDLAKAESGGRRTSDDLALRAAGASLRLLPWCDPLGIPQRLLAARALTCSISQTTLCHACSRVYHRAQQAAHCHDPRSERGAAPEIGARTGHCSHTG